MKKYGKITALIAGVVLALGFASCKADTDDGSTFYTVTFNSMGSTEVSSQSIESGKKATSRSGAATFVRKLQKQSCSRRFFWVR